MSNVFSLLWSNDTQCLKMAPTKTRYFLFPAAFLLLSFIPTVAEVVMSVSDCDLFLLEKTPPQVPGILQGGHILNQNRYKPICQTFENERRFLTLYDIKNKIPVFSAYKYRGNGEGRRPQTWWKIEPQVGFSFWLVKDNYLTERHFYCKMYVFMANLSAWVTNHLKSYSLRMKMTRTWSSETRTKHTTTRLGTQITETTGSLTEAIYFQALMHSTRLTKCPPSPWPTLFRKWKHSTREAGTEWNSASNVLWINTALTTMVGLKGLW